MSANGCLVAYVLHSRRYGDSSLLLELFTREQGRSGCIAKGVLRSRGRGTESPQPFHPLSISLRGRGELRTLGTCESNGHAVRLVGSMLYCGLYLNELLLKLTAREDPMPALFDDYADALGMLAKASDPEPVLRCFEVRLLHHLGHGMLLDRDAEGRGIDPDRRYTYAIGSGAVPAIAESGSIGGQTLLALHVGQGEQLSGDPRRLREARQLMRAVLDHYLDGRPLRSRDLFR